MTNRSMWATVAVLLVVGLPMLAMAADEDALQDVCVKDTTRGLLPINGFPCKPFGKVVADDFKFVGLKIPGNTNNPNKAAVTAATVIQFPGLNTLGISAVRIDNAKGGINPPHTHPRATELLVQLNIGQGPALGFAGLSSQNPGVQQVAPSLFVPKIKDEVLEMGFRIDTKTVNLIRSKFP